MTENHGISKFTVKDILAGEIASGLFTTFHVDTSDGERFLQRLAGRFLCFAPKIVEHSRYLLAVERIQIVTQS